MILPAFNVSKMDFSLNQYTQLLLNIKSADYSFLTFEKYFKKIPQKLIILRHDVDKLPENSLQFAKIQRANNISASYYFRLVPVSFNKEIILEIASLGHEIGYHYETMDTSKGNVDKAYDEFCRNLDTLRKLVPVNTICMHGSPRSPYDNRDIWKKYNYRNLGIIGEPYFDIDFRKVAYYTDTGRMWDGNNVSVRDKISGFNPEGSVNQQSGKGTNHSSERNVLVETWSEDNMISVNNRFPVYHSTSQMIESIKNNSFPKSAMLTFHPQRWTDNPVLWVKELIAQGAKNTIKKWFFVKHSSIIS